MVEKAGHKRQLITKRSEWINEGKPKTADEEGDNNDEQGDDPPAVGTTGTAPPTVGATTQAGRPATPDRDVPDDDDLYGATPQRTGRTVPIIPNEPDPDDLDALMAEAENQDASNQQRKPPAARQQPVDDEDDLDALIAEAEGHDMAQKPPSGPAGQDAGQKGNTDYADDEAALQEMEGLW